MSVAQLKDGRWLCRFPKGKDHSSPQSNKKYFGRGPAAESRAWAFNESLGLGRRSEKTSDTIFTAIANEYLLAKRSTMTSSSFEDAEQRLEAVILPYFGNQLVSSINHSLIDDFVAMRLKKVKKATVCNDLVIVRAILSFALNRRLIAFNPFHGYVLPKRDHAVIMPPSRKEVEAIAACAVPHVKRAIWLSYYTGLRPGKVEMLGLEWGSVDFINGLIMISSAKKGGLPARMVPIAKPLMVMLKEWYAEDQNNGHRLLVHYHGSRVDSIKKAWAAAKRRAKVTRRIRLYDLRHAFVTRLLENGADLKSVSEMAGHASPEITMKVYQHVTNDLKRKAIDLLD